MAIKKCKECGMGISTTAKVCPHCGKKYPTGGFTWPAKIFLLLIILFVLSSFISDSGNSESMFKDVLSLFDPMQRFKEGVESYVKKTLEGTSIHFKEIGGIKSDSFLGSDYTAIVLVNIPNDKEERILTVKIAEFQDHYTMEWDNKSLGIIALYKLGGAVNSFFTEP